jgi:UDP-N-acetylmuramyl pentapeptide phosphotransferase/UDP-N-acetylglucosamine-1-phosphate transferase
MKVAKVELAAIDSRKGKENTPIMGGLLVIITVAVMSILFNWSRSFTWVPVGVMILSAVLGGVDDLLNIFGAERRSRKLSHIITLIKVHKDFKMRIWYALTLPGLFLKELRSGLVHDPGKECMYMKSWCFSS